MKIHGLLVCRDEVDIIRESMRSALAWVDCVHVLDSGSTDGTWEILRQLAAESAKVNLLRREPLFFEEALRARLFSEVRELMRAGDWVVKLDADEFYPGNCRRWLLERIRGHETVVFVQWYYFRLTKQDVEQWERGSEAVEDRAKPIEKRRRWFQMPEFTEWRMFKYRPSMRWDRYSATPFNMGYPAKALLPVMHFPHRDPEQMRRRFLLRAKVKAFCGQHGVYAGQNPHWDLEDWRKEVVDPAECERSGARGDYDERGILRHVSQDSGTRVMKGLDGPLHEYRPGEPLPEGPKITSHLPRGWRKLAMRALHPYMVPLVDRLRPKFDPTWQGTPMPEELQAALTVAPQEVSEL